MTDKPITSGQKKQIWRLIEDATIAVGDTVEELGLTREEAQRVIENGDIVALDIIHAAMKAIGEAIKPPPRFKNDMREEG